jgi:hypothetical protein
MSNVNVSAGSNEKDTCRYVSKTSKLFEEGVDKKEGHPHPQDGSLMLKSSAAGELTKELPRIKFI